MSIDVVVYGATGLVGRLACYELDAAGVEFAICGRDQGKLAALAMSCAVDPIVRGPIEQTRPS